MLIVYKALLGPLLLVQGGRARRNALRLPEAAGPREGIAGSAAKDMPPLRVLFFGDSSAAGVGVEHQDEALAARTAAFLSARIGVPVAWQLVAKSGITTNEALSLLAASELKPADLLVTSLGVNDVTAQRSTRQFLADYQTIVDQIARRAGTKATIINGLPPMHAFPAMPQPLRWYLGACARRLDTALQGWVSANQSMSYVSLQWGGAGEMAPDGYHPGASQYRHWAQLVADRAMALRELQTVLRQAPPEQV
jgi:lysophospholipase L1-like esterase